MVLAHLFFWELFSHLPKPSDGIGIYLAAMLAVYLPAQGHAQSREIKLKPAEIYTNETSHFQFPPAVADFKRAPTCTLFDQEGRDIGVGYNDLLHGTAATIFIYPIAKEPPNDTIKGHFAVCKASVRTKHDDAKLVSEGKVQMPSDRHKQDGLRATFTFTDVFAHQRQLLRSDLYLFKHEQFFISFRITYAAVNQAPAELAIKAFIDGFAWP